MKMTTIILDDDTIKKTHFLNAVDLLDYLLSTINIEFEDFTYEEKTVLDNIKWMKEFKNLVKNLADIKNKDFKIYP